MTDTEIIKALECLCDYELGDCHKCPIYKHIDKDCTPDIVKPALDLINRQKAEIERLCIELDETIIAKDLLFDEAEVLIKKAKAEAIKEFAERVKVLAKFNYIVWDEQIDYIVKEMVGNE